MKWMTIGALAAMMAASAWAQSDADYQGYMKAVFAANGSMQKNVAAKSADAAADAKKLQKVRRALSVRRRDEAAAADRIVVRRRRGSILLPFHPLHSPGLFGSSAPRTLLIG